MLYWHHSYDLRMKIGGGGEEQYTYELTYELERNAKHLYKSPLQPKKLQITETQLRLLLQPF